jgi:hypothetical protein
MPVQNGNFSVIASLGGSGQRITVSRPIEDIKWKNIPIEWRPLLGHSINYTEQYTLEFLPSGNSQNGTYRWDDRFYQQAFIGHWQATNNEGNTGLGAEVTEFGQIIGNLSPLGGFVWIYRRRFQLTWTLSLGDVFAASITTIDNCNGDLAPGAVANNFINAGDVNQYVQIAYGIATGDLVNAATLIDKLTQPTTAGYKFGDKNLFTAFTGIDSVDLSDAILYPQIDNLGLWIHPDFQLTNAAWGCNFQGVDNVEKLSNQFPDMPFDCNYSGGIQFPQ